MKFAITAACLLSLAFCFLPTATATDVCGTVSGNWDLAGSPYTVTCDITVAPDQILTIDAGVRVIFLGHYTMLVNGVLQAFGTEEDSIYFTTNTVSNPEQWNGLRLEDAGNSSIIRYCVVENAHYSNSDAYSSGGGLTIWRCSPKVVHSTIRYNSSVHNGGGLAVDYSNTNPIIEDCTIEHNSSVYGGGAAVSNDAHTTFRRCLITHNWVQQGGGVGSWGGYPTLINCTVTENHGDDAGGIRATSTSIITLINTIVANNTGAAGIANYSMYPMVVRYSDIYGNQGMPSYGDCGTDFGLPDHTNIHGLPCDRYDNLFMNPQFVDASHDNYHLRSNSPCIDAGDPSTEHDPDGTIADMGAFSSTQDPNDVTIGTIDIPTDYAMSAYPNPFNPSTTLSITLNKSGFVRVTVYDMTGRIVKELVNGQLGSGVHSVSFNGADLPTGVYIARMESAGISRIQKLLLLK
jgi:hypothetical protein